MKLKAAIKSIAAVAAAVVAAKGETEPDVIRTSAGEYVLNFQLPEGETLSPQKVAEIAARDGVRVIGFQPPRGLLVRMAEPNGLNAVGKVEGVRRAQPPEFAEGAEAVAVDVFPWGADLAESVGAKIVELGGKSLTVEVVPPSGPAAAFVRIVIPSVNG